LLTFSSGSDAQTVIRPTSQQQIQNRDWSRGNLRDRVATAQYQRELERARLGMRNDFRKLQLVNNELMLRVFKPVTTDTEKITPKEIRSSLGEIKKLAERLRLNFGFEKITTLVEKQNELIPLLDLLDTAVVTFVQNPLFQQPRVYDIELATKAEKNLGEILTLVDVLRKLTKE
jgi:hypothetical protein